jgi:hypothetical protein
MELPIQLRIFRKIELFQELKNRNKKSKKTNLKAWEIEKDILSLTKYHHHIGSVLTIEKVKDWLEHVVSDKRYSEGELSNWLKKSIENLIEDGFAKRTSESNEELKFLFTRDGMIMGEVVNELKGNCLKKIAHNLKYYSLTYLVWLSVILAMLYVVVSSMIYFYSLLAPHFEDLISKEGFTKKIEAQYLNQHETRQIHKKSPNPKLRISTPRRRRGSCHQ